jgi:hypothetical protein
MILMGLEGNSCSCAKAGVAVTGRTIKPMKASRKARIGLLLEKSGVITFVNYTGALCYVKKMRGICL